MRETIYSLRHTAITFRLLYSRKIDLLTLARNARTSMEMIDRFYASDLSAEMNIDLLQGRGTSRVVIDKGISLSFHTSVRHRPVTGLWANQFRKAANYPMCRNVGKCTNCHPSDRGKE